MLFLNWQNTQEGTQDWFVLSLFNTLSPRWYPKNIIGSTDYDFLSMYAQEFVVADVEIQQTYDDLAIETCRTIPVANNTTSKLYDNFGRYFETNILFSQDYETFNSGSLLQGYRQELRFLYQAFIAGTTVGGLTKIGQAFTGVSPIIIQPMHQYPRWKLSVYSGSVTYAGNDFIISNIFIPRLGYIIPTNTPSSFSVENTVITDDTNQVITDDTNQVITDDVGSNFVISYSHLGASTKLGGHKYQYDTLEVTFFASNEFCNSSSTASVTSLAYDVIAANQILRINYSNNYVYYRPQVVSESIPLTDVLMLSSLGYIYNSDRIFGTGAVVETNVVELPSGYQNYDWYYDWLVSYRDTASYVVEVRQYPSASIPDTVYYKSFDKDLPELLPSISTDANQAHWQFTSVGSVPDISAHKNTLQYIDGTPERIMGRNPNYLGLRGNFDYGTASVARLSFSDSMRAEMWLLGIDNSCQNGSFSIGTQDSVTGDSYTIGLNSSTQTAYFNVSIGGVESVSGASIANLFAEAPMRYHYLAFSYASGSVFFTVDGNLIGTGSISGLPNIAYGITKINNSCNLGVDEILLGNEFSFPYDEFQNFQSSKERIRYLGMNSGSVEPYHQAKFTLFGYGEKDIEFHQFSIRGFNTPFYRSAETNYWDILQVPIYHY